MSRIPAVQEEHVHLVYLEQETTVKTFSLHRDISIQPSHTNTTKYQLVQSWKKCVRHLWEKQINVVNKLLIE